jgi:plasmid stability protein
MTTEPTHTTVRGVDPDLWRALKVEAARQRKTRGELLNEILSAALLAERTGLDLDESASCSICSRALTAAPGG